ncbi:MAG: HAMP domain-containing protein [Sedimentisphaerales bacterium]|nr:HAMP domain-containing protein [Sedimentisphaerales bacterium]
MRIRISWKFFAAFTLLTIVTIVILTVLLVLWLKNDVEAKISQRLESNAVLTGEIFKSSMARVEPGDIQPVVKDVSDKLKLRITVMNNQGKVLGDSERDPTTMENHGDRVEFKNAIEKGVGMSARLSHTLNYSMKYVAVRVAEGDEIVGVVRIAVPLSEVQIELNKLYRAAISGAAAAIFIAVILAYLMARSISSPIRRMKKIAERIAKGDFSEKTLIKGDDELADLAGALNSMSDELQIKIERLRQLDRVRSDFVANVSHELKTPLTSILGFVETLEDGAINDRDNAQRFLAIIKKHARRLGSIIDDLLRLSELESGVKMEIGRVNLKELLDEVVMGFGHALSAKRQSITVESEAGDFSVIGDKDKLEQVFVNLIDNAIKYTKEGGKIKVQLADSQDFVVITVEDNGIGIPKEDIERVFERFYRVDKAHSREIGGTGLGLSIAKHMVLAHKGEICIDSELGKGTKVLITIPKTQK